MEGIAKDNLSDMYQLINISPVQFLCLENPPMSAPPTTPQPMSQGVVLLLATATGLSVGTQYYNQPLLGLIADDLGVGSDVSLVAIATQIGYALGLILLGPLGDKVDRRRVILCQCIGLVGATLCASAATGLYSLAIASVLVGIFATLAQQIIPLASELSPAILRERVLASITGALLIGVLLARVVSGFVGANLGWRAMFLVGAGLSLMMLAGLAAKLPKGQVQTRASYLQLLASLFAVVRDSAELRKATLVQSLIFFGFSAFWTILTLLLQGPEFALGSDTAGLFGVVALLGVMLAPRGLRLSRQYAGHVGIALVVASFVVMIACVNLLGLSIGAILMTTGLQMSLVYNQSRILALAGTARGRFNTLFMASQFACGAAGSAAASVSWASGGWTAVMALALIASVAAMLVQFAYPTLTGDSTHD